MIDILEGPQKIYLDWEEVKQIAFDFTNELASSSSATLSTSVTTCEAFINIDAQASAVLASAGTIVGNQVLIKVKGNSLDVVYKIRCKAVDSTGQTHVISALIDVKRF